MKQIAEAWGNANREFEQIIATNKRATQTDLAASEAPIATPWYEATFHFGKGPWSDSYATLDIPPERIRNVVLNWSKQERYRRARSIVNDQKYREDSETFIQECCLVGACGHHRNWFMFCPPLIKLSHDVASQAGLKIPVGHHSIYIMQTMIEKELHNILEAENRWRHYDFSDLPTQAPQADVELAPNGQPFLKTKALLESYIDHTRKPKKTASKLRLVLRYIDEIVGHESTLNEVNKEVLIKLQTKALHLPARLTKNERASDFMTLSMGHYATNRSKLTPQAVRSWFNLLGGFFNWSVGADYLHKNPTNGVKPKIKKMELKGRCSFDSHEIAVIFSERYPKKSLDSRFWLPLLALTTGARLNELGQLTREDVILEPFPCLKITDKSNNPHVSKRLKNLNSRRVIPLHPIMIDIGFVKFYENGSDTYLFTDLPHPKTIDDYEPTKAFSQWFGRYLHRIGIKKPGKVFHSFRHTFITLAREASLNPKIVSEIVGHESDPQLSALLGSTMTARYGERIKLETVYNELSKIDFSYLSHLK